MEIKIGMKIIDHGVAIVEIKAVYIPANILHYIPGLTAQNRSVIKTWDRSVLIAGPLKSVRI
jgi:hypothetical protein